MQRCCIVFRIKVSRAIQMTLCTCSCSQPNYFRVRSQGHKNHAPELVMTDRLLEALKTQLGCDEEGVKMWFEDLARIASHSGI